MLSVFKTARIIARRIIAQNGLSGNLDPQSTTLRNGLVIHWVIFRFYFGEVKSDNKILVAPEEFRTA